MAHCLSRFSQSFVLLVADQSGSSEMTSCQIAYVQAICQLKHSSMIFELPTLWG